MGNIQVRDFRIGGCRRGTFSQNYNQRAGTWVPGNYATAQTTYTVPTFPSFTGGGGSYAGLSTLQFSSSVKGGSDDWQTGCNVFIREGRTVERGRLLDAVVGPSDNIADLALHAIQRSSRIPTSMIDIDSFTAAARFTEANGFWFNGEIKEPSNLADWLTKILPLFLLRQTRVAGKHGLRPLLPANADGTINSGRLAADWLLTETIIVPDSFQRTWVDAGTVPKYQATWRQQVSDTDPPIARTIETAGADPAEQLDMAPFCTTELHAARAAQYQRALRLLSTHTATVILRPGTQTGLIRQGDIVQIKYPITTPRETGQFNEWYQVDNVTQATSGEESLSLIHFPVTISGQSLLALAVTETTVPGILLPTNQTGQSCDVFERDTDTSVPDQSSGGGAPGGAYSGPTRDGGKGPGFDRAGGPDRSRQARTPTDGGGQRAQGQGQPGDNRCPIGYEAVDFVAITPYTTGGAVVTSTTTYVDNARSWPRIIRTDEYDGISPYLQYRDWLVYIDSNGVQQMFGLTYLIPQLPGYSASLYQVQVLDFACRNGDFPSPTILPEWYVRPGDTLNGIANSVYNDPGRSQDIYNANKDRIDDPNLIFPGQWLKIPS